ncbi:MAG: hypothetical protein R2800_01060 [Flavipsychrobacter sp.]
MININKWGKLSSLCTVALLSIIIYSCDTTKTPDVSAVEVKLSSSRLDRDLATIDTNNIGAGLAQLSAKYPHVLDFYLDTLMGFGIKGDYVDDNPAIKEGLKTFLTHKDYRGVFDSVNAHFEDTKELEKQIELGLKYTKYYIPDYREPNFVYVVSGLNNWGAFSFGDNNVGIGLDMFLGEGYPFYRSVGIATYMYTKLDEQYLPVAVFRAIYQNRHEFLADGKSLLDMMIQRGKEMYFLEKVLPFVSNEVRLGYTPEQLAWCEANEGMIYDFFIRENLLYENSIQKVIRYVMDGPSSTGMPEASPGDIGAWVGLQIVKAYANEHQELSVQEIIDSEIEAQRILTESKYKPK